MARHQPSRGPGASDSDDRVRPAGRQLPHADPAEREGQADDRERPNHAPEHLTRGRDHRGDERDRRADERDRQADERDRMADVRERIADERERLADEREREADERENVADQSEREAEDPEPKAAERDAMDEVGHGSGLHVPGRREEVLERVERSQRLTAVAKDRLARSRAALDRLAADAERQQAAIDRAMAQTERELARLPHSARPDPGVVRELRRRLSATAIALAAAEEKAALIYGDLAADRPDRAVRYQQYADDASELARKARDVARKLSEGPDA